MDIALKGDGIAVMTLSCQAESSTKLDSTVCSPNVLAGGKQVGVVPQIPSPTMLHGCNHAESKNASPSVGSANVTANGLPVHRIGDSRTCSDITALPLGELSRNVAVN